MDKSNSGSLWSGTGAYPTGFVFSNGKIAYQDVSDTQLLDGMALDSQGKMIIGSHSISDLKKLQVSEAISFGPALVINGKATFSGDGGSSSTMYYKDSIINNPCNPLGERTVATALYVEP